ncbi:hypothetical protein V8E52_008830 [Russula decolorans]
MEALLFLKNLATTVPKGPGRRPLFHANKKRGRIALPPRELLRPLRMSRHLYGYWPTFFVQTDDQVTRCATAPRYVKTPNTREVPFYAILLEYSPTSVRTRRPAELNWKHEICWTAKMQDGALALRPRHGVGTGNLRESVYYLIVPHQGDKADKFCIFSCFSPMVFWLYQFINILYKLETNDVSRTITSDPNWKRYRLRLVMRNGRLWQAMRRMRVVDASPGPPTAAPSIIGIDLPALMFRCEQSAVDTPRAYRYCMSECEHVNVIAGAIVGMVFTAKQPILWGCCYAASMDMLVPSCGDAVCRSTPWAERSRLNVITLPLPVAIPLQQKIKKKKKKKKRNSHATVPQKMALATTGNTSSSGSKWNPTALDQRSLPRIPPIASKTYKSGGTEEEGDLHCGVTRHYMHPSVLEAPTWENLKTWPFTCFDDTQRAIGSGTVPVVLLDATVVEHFDWNVRRGL